MPSGNLSKGSIRIVFGGLLIMAVMSARSVCSVMPPAPPADGGVAAKAVDLRPIFKNWGLEVRSQGGRGTCSAFVVTGALEYAAASQRRVGTPLSVEFLNWASNEATGQAADGGFFSDLWKGFAASGICPEQDMPYQEGESKPFFQLPPWPERRIPAVTTSRSTDRRCSRPISVRPSRRKSISYSGRTS